jgi:hypothetical protein
MQGNLIVSTRNLDRFWRFYPPVALRDPTYNVPSGTGYGAGTYTVTSSAEDEQHPFMPGLMLFYQAFTMQAATQSGWGFAPKDTYNSSTGLSARDEQLFEGSPRGEWVTIQMPGRIFVAGVGVYSANIRGFRLYGRNSDGGEGGTTPGQWRELYRESAAVYRTFDIHEDLYRTNLFSIPGSMSEKYDTFGFIATSIHTDSQFVNGLTFSSTVFARWVTLYEGMLTPCAEGSFAYSWDVCMGCPMGTYSAQSSMELTSACSPCPANTYSD